MPKAKNPLFSFQAYGRLGPVRYSTSSRPTYIHWIGIAWWIVTQVFMWQFMAMFQLAAKHWKDKTPIEDALFKSLQHRIPKPYSSKRPRARWTPYTLYMHYRLKLGAPGMDPLVWQAEVQRLWDLYMHT